MSKAIAVFDMPNSCIDCPMVSSYGRKCKLSKKSFAKKELISMTGRYPFKYKPE